MLRVLKNVVLSSICFCFFLTSCMKKEFEDFYKRPDNLADPIYQQLVSRGNFTSLLKCIDKAGYKETLSSGGYWTFFAADDDAFSKYLNSIGKSNADDIDAELARKIVTYNLVYNAYREDELIKYQAPGQAASIKPEYAFKRKTAYYDFVYTTKVKDTLTKVINTNRNGGGYIASDNNNKYIPYFSIKSLQGIQLSASDYKQLFPNADYEDFNVVDAKVKERNIAAENGIIHVIDKVILPLDNIDSYVASQAEYSEFKKLLDLAATYTYNDEITKRYQALSNSTDKVYLKQYNSSLAFSPNNENFLNAGTDAQINGYSIFVPTNAELLAYTKDVLKYYKTFEEAPRSILYDFINAHMWRTQVWLSKINNEGNAAGETANFSPSSIIEKKVLSNGFFYGIKAVQRANAFHTIYSFAYLDPKYKLMKFALDGGLKPSITIPAAKYTMFMMSDTEIRAAGYDYYDDKSNWGYLKPGTTGTVDVSDGAKARINRILETSVIPTLNGELDNLSGKGIVEAYNGEYIKYDAGKVYASGNVETNTPVTIDSSGTAINGKVYYTKNLLTFTETPVPVTIAKLATDYPSDFGHFWNYLKNASIFGAADNSILQVALGSFYTFLIPNNAAIEKAVKDGVLPGNTTTGVPNFTSADPRDVEKVTNFIYYHILDKNTVASDGQKSGGYATLLKNANGNVLFLNVVSPAKNNLSFNDAYGNNVTININRSNNLAYRTIIHSLNSYLKFNVQ